MMRITVVLPAPFGPRKPKHSPGEMAKSMPSTAVMVPYAFDNFCAETIDITLHPVSGNTFRTRKI